MAGRPRGADRDLDEGVLPELIEDVARLLQDRVGGGGDDLHVQAALFSAERLDLPQAGVDVDPALLLQDRGVGGHADDRPAVQSLLQIFQIRGVKHQFIHIENSLSVN